MASYVGRGDSCLKTLACGDLVSLPHVLPNTSEWVYKIKIHSSGSLELYKAHFMVHDFHMKNTIERYKTVTKDNISRQTVQQDIEKIKADAEGLSKKLDALEACKSKLLGQNLEECSIEELQSLELKIEKSLLGIRAVKTRRFEEQLSTLRQKETKLRQDNEELYSQCQKEQHLALAAPPAPATLAAPPAPATLAEQSQDVVDVETDLFLGLPGTGRS
ncbi:MADS-box transcription factor 50 [Triticum urartu]|uniref:K-box domain-containing protein n=2 Tax=Triticum TaxID=4564 RepID=A0A9R0U597_TRITD|nr:MADS-box transcription factor 50 [Triticum urartu]VAI25126.1 unnamed protein product [Triticum turgidum subsp. durum]